MNKDFPILFSRKEECCGCTACYSICQQHAIHMKPDGEGFEYPVLIKEKCICCYQCLDVCPLKKH